MSSFNVMSHYYFHFIIKYSYQDLEASYSSEHFQAYFQKLEAAE